jgi:hypothetical protein
MGVKRGKGAPASAGDASDAQSRKEKSAKAKRHARIVLGTPPPSHVLTPRLLKPPKHKKPPGEEDDG